ncbi:MAG: helix-turn-helix domain-containing protein [Chloroflexi bacterium]|nr:helix-turn-helix domain-containing protein [Chloroflexota bacterium]
MPVGPAGRAPRHPPAAATERPAWLAIHEASDLIGVSEATLRRWAEAGDVEAFVTPGGHRRFTRSALLRLLPRPGRPHRTLRQLGGTPERIVLQYRRDLSGPATNRWLPGLDEPGREAFRGPGRQILEGVLGYLDAATDEAGQAAIATAIDAATTYGRLARERGLGTTGSTEAFLRFRSPFLEELATIARRRRVDASEAISLIIAAAGVFDRLLLALLEGHAAPEHEPVPAASPSSASTTEA